MHVMRLSPRQYEPDHKDHTDHTHQEQYALKDLDHDLYMICTYFVGGVEAWEATDVIHHSYIKCRPK